MSDNKFDQDPSQDDQPKSLEQEAVDTENLDEELEEELQDNNEDQEVHEDRGFINTLTDLIEEDDSQAVYDFLLPYDAPEVADVLEVLGTNDRRDLIRLLGDKLDPEVLSEIEGDAQTELYDQIPNEQIADAVSDMDTDDAVYVLEELDDYDRSEVLRALPSDDRAAIEENLSYPDDSAGRMMQRDLVALPEFWSVGQAIDLLRDQSVEMPEDFYEVFVVSPAHEPVGTVSLAKLMRSHRAVGLTEIMNGNPNTISVHADQEDVAYQFTKYHLISAAVVDDSSRLVGMVTVDDVVDVIGEEAEEDILALAGVGEGSMGDSVSAITKDRFKWLFVNLLTAILASIVIGIYEGTIAQMVALAVLMPIVASMGGNAATQTMTVTVRAIATKEITASNMGRAIFREFRVAFINGVLLSLISGCVAYIWFGDGLLSAIFLAAMIFNLIIAGLCGIMVPLMVDRLGQDPAIASSVFVTTITDVVGFFAFLGLASALLPSLS